MVHTDAEIGYWGVSTNIDKIILMVGNEMDQTRCVLSVSQAAEVIVRLQQKIAQVQSKS